MNRLMRLIGISLGAFILILGGFFLWIMVISPIISDKIGTFEQKANEKRIKSYVPDQNLISQYLQEFNKKDTELSHTEIYNIDSIENPSSSESPYGKFMSNELLFFTQSGIDCNQLIRSLKIVGARSSYRMISTYSGDVITGKKKVRTFGVCGIEGHIILPENTPYEKFLAAEKFLNSKKDIFSVVSRNEIASPN